MRHILSITTDGPPSSSLKRSRTDRAHIGASLPNTSDAVFQHGFEARPMEVPDVATEDLSEEEDGPPLATQGRSAAPLIPPPSDDEDEPQPTQGAAPQAPFPHSIAHAGPHHVAESSYDDDPDDDADSSMTLGCPASPMVRLVVGDGWLSSSRAVRVALTGLRDGRPLLRYRYHSLAAALGAEVECGHVISSAVTHVVVFPSVGAKRTAKSIWAALTGKLLVSPCWLDASTQRGRLLPLVPAAAIAVVPVSTASCAAAADAPAAAADAPAAAADAPAPDAGGAADAVGTVDPDGTADATRLPPLQAVRGIVNPLDGKRVQLTRAFREQHREDSVVGALLTTQAYLLKAATLVPDANAGVDLVFASDAEESEELRLRQCRQGQWRHADSRSGDGCAADESSGLPVVHSWESFLERLVPGHSRRWLRRSRSRKTPLPGGTLPAPGCSTAQ